VQQRLDALAPDSPVSSGEHRVILPDGSVGWNRWTDRALFDEQGRLLEYQSVGRDIAERKQAEEALRESEARLKEAQRSAHIGDWEVDLATGAVTWSDELYRIMRYDPDPDLRLDTLMNELCHPDDRARAEQAIQDAIATGELSPLEFRVITGDGEERIIWSKGKIIHDSHGRPARFVGVNQDVTERKAMESQLREASKMEAIGRLAGGIAHDFNNMLMGVIGYTHFLRQRVDDPSLTSDLDSVRKLADRGANLTQQLLAFGRRQRLERRVLDLNHQIETTGRMLPRLIGENIELQFSPAPDLAYVSADPAQIDQILMNLAVNARDAMPRGGALTIGTGNVTFDAEYVARNPGSKAGDYAMFAVADTGEGMDEETLSHLFEPFYTTKEVGRGTGLGLATIYGIVKQHDGYITVSSQLSKGTVFRIYLPRAEGELGDPDQGPTQSRGPRGQETVLMVEDEPTVRDVIGRALREHGYQVLLAGNADEALAIAERHEGTITLLLTDIVMPGRSGRELYAELLTKRPKIKALFMSGYDEQSVIVRDVQAAGLPFIPKPIDVHEIAWRVRRVIDG